MNLYWSHEEGERMDFEYSPFEGGQGDVSIFSYLNNSFPMLINC
jgi:hypothetical protein